MCIRDSSDTQKFTFSFKSKEKGMEHQLTQPPRPTPSPTPNPHPLSKLLCVFLRLRRKSGHQPYMYHAWLIRRKKSSIVVNSRKKEKIPGSDLLAKHWSHFHPWGRFYGAALLTPRALLVPERPPRSDLVLYSCDIRLELFAFLSSFLFS